MRSSASGKWGGQVLQCFALAGCIASRRLCWPQLGLRTMPHSRKGRWHATTVLSLRQLDGKYASSRAPVQRVSGSSRRDVVPRTKSSAFFSPKTSSSSAVTTSSTPSRAPARGPCPNFGLCQLEPPLRTCSDTFGIAIVGRRRSEARPGFLDCLKWPGSVDSSSSWLFIMTNVTLL